MCKTHRTPPVDGARLDGFAVDCTTQYSASPNGWPFGQLKNAQFPDSLCTLAPAPAH